MSRKSSSKISSTLSHDDSINHHHRQIWSDALSASQAERPPIYYVENHNTAIGYSEAADDFEMLVDSLLPRLDPHELGNWTTPILHLARQTIELRLKALLQAIVDRDQTIDKRHLGKHDLSAIWHTGRDWIQNNGYGLDRDARLKMTDELITAFHSVDPSGDLFRFAQSRQERFGKRKSSDRVGVNHEKFPLFFRQTVSLLRHWETVLLREKLKVEKNWEEDPYFDPNDYPKEPSSSSNGNS